MTRATSPDPRQGIDGPDLEDPLAADDIVNHPGRPEEPPDHRAGGDSQATRLVALAQGHYRLLRGEDGRMYATAHDGPAVAFGLRGRDGLRTRLARLYYASFGQTPGGAALTDALTVLQGQAEMADPEPVALRVAAVGDRGVALDLGRADGRCVLIDGHSWRIEDRSPVLFRRSPLTAPMPDPRRGGRLAPLAGLLNVDERRFRLIVAWLVSCLIPEVPHPILALVGEQGTAKTTAARLVVSLVRPVTGPDTVAASRDALVGRVRLGVVDRDPRQRVDDPCLVVRHPVQGGHGRRDRRAGLAHRRRRHRPHVPAVHRPHDHRRRQARR